MAGTTLYLIRSSNILYARQDNVIDVYLSGSKTAYASVTGNASTNVVTITGATLADGMLLTFTTLTGGSGVSTGVSYIASNSSGSTCKLTTVAGGSVVALGTNITAGSVIVQASPMQVWSSEFRDIFEGLGVQGSTISNTNVGATLGAPQGFGIFMDPDKAISTTATGAAIGAQFALTGSPKATVSDEVGHEPLRQTLLNKTFWIFDRGASATPRYLPAEYQEGDIIATSPPNTP